MTYKIGILVPSTTHMRDWKTIEETSLYSVFLKTFLTTYCKQHKYTIYLTIDDDDRIYSNPNEKN